MKNSKNILDESLGYVGLTKEETLDSVQWENHDQQIAASSTMGPKRTAGLHSPQRLLSEVIVQRAIVDVIERFHSILGDATLHDRMTGNHSENHHQCLQFLKHVSLTLSVWGCCVLARVRYPMFPRKAGVI
jgi:hypothetical protein